MILQTQEFLGLNIAILGAVICGDVLPVVALDSRLVARLFARFGALPVKMFGTSRISATSFLTLILLPKTNHARSAFEIVHKLGFCR